MSKPKEEITLIFPHQLFEEHPTTTSERPVMLVEEYLFFRQYKFHKQKIAFHRASMRRYAKKLEEAGHVVRYINSQDKRQDIRNLIPALATEGIVKIHLADPVDDWLSTRLAKRCKKEGIELIIADSPLFLNSREDLKQFFHSDKKKFLQTQFYIQQRKDRNLLLNGEGGPEGGKWSFDAENRKKYPRKKVPPTIEKLQADSYWREACEYVEAHFAENPGTLGEAPFYPTSRTESQVWLDRFLENRFKEFGPYEDAIVESAHFLHHSVLTPMLNVGLISPQEILEKVIEYSSTNDIPIQTTEGFIRQVIGWREFMRGMYESRGREQRSQNFWGFSRKIPASFYDGTTGIPPIDNTIKKVLKTGYAHHIERLMILGNFMLLCEFDPKEVYRWFMELFIDAYDWVMVPNVYGMSQFADGGLLSTKPYISGSNYLKKMSDYAKGDWQEIWDALFWRFMSVHRDFFSQNPRLSMLLRTLDKMTGEKRSGLMDKAEAFLESLDQSLATD